MIYREQSDIYHFFVHWYRFRKILPKIFNITENGIISTAQYKTACSAWLQSKARLSSIFMGKHRATARFYQLCAELAHKKYQLEKLEEFQYLKVIEKTRSELAQLASQAYS